MLDVKLFTNLRFTAASGAVTLAFFALSGFIFLIILYFQIMRGYSALEAGVRTLPVAACIAIASGLGPALVVRLGNKLVVSAGLVLVAAGYGWVALVQTQTTSYGLIVAQMVLLGLGMGLSTAPATEAILGVVRPEQAGVGSAVNDATRLIGGTLGVAVLGSVYASLYRTKIDEAAVPAAMRAAARASYGAGHAVAAQLPGLPGRRLLAQANSGFLDGLTVGCSVAAAVCLVGAAIVIAFLPSHPEVSTQHDESRAAVPARAAQPTIGPHEEESVMPDLVSADGRGSSVIVDPTLRAYRRRYFVQTGRATAGRAFSRAGALRLARRTSTNTRWATLKQKWDLAIEREAAHRRAVGL